MSASFALPAELNIYNAIAIREALLAWIAKHEETGDALQVSAKEVAEIDGAGLQLLAALSNSGVVWRAVDASVVFNEACRTLGFAQWIVATPAGQAKGVA